MTVRLSDATLAAIPPTVSRPQYDRSALRSGVLHFGPGAFHRAHQASYFDALAARDPGWGITGVSLNSVGVQAALQPQDGLYTLVVRDEVAETKVIGALREVLAAPREPEAIWRHFASPDLRMITLTVTEKGYPLDADGAFDRSHAAVRSDLRQPGSPAVLTGWLVEGLRRRRAAGLTPPPILSCDNLDDNGGKLQRAVVAHARLLDPGLADWIDGEGRFPRTMVDSITPATDDALRAEVETRLGLRDAWPVQRERYRRWVIEDLAGVDLAPLASVGAVLTTDVAGHAEAKLRLLNAVHSTLAYLGLLRGHATVAQAMADPALATFCTALALDCVIPTLDVPSLDLPEYAAAILQRLANPAIAHRLIQIATDGSRKLPVRLFPTIEAALRAEAPIERPALALAGWMRWVVSSVRAGQIIEDPAACLLSGIARSCSDDAHTDVTLFLERFVPPRLASDPRLVEAVERGYRRLTAGLV